MPNCNSPATDHPALSARQQQLIAALLTENSVAAAAKVANCSRTSAYRWLEEPDFREAFQAARREVVDRAATQIQSASTEAVAALRGVLQDPGAPAYARVAAARFMVDSALRVRELQELEGRIEELHQRLDERVEADRLREAAE